MSIIALMFSALFTSFLLAQSASGILTPEQTLAIRQPSDPRVSPDSTRVAFVVTEPPRGTERNRDIWMLSVRSGEVRQLTYTSKDDWSPRWSPDARSLAFLSDRDGQPQIYLLPMNGGEAVRLTTGKANIQSFEWSPDGNRIAFLARDGRAEAEERREREKDDARVVDRDDKRPRLWLLDVNSKNVHEVIREPWCVSEVKWLPQGDRLLVVATDRPAADQYTNRIFLVSPDDGVMTFVAGPRGPFFLLNVSPDGRTIAYVAARADGPSPHDLYLQTIGASAHNLTGAALDRPVLGVQWQSSGQLLILAAAGFKSGFHVAGKGAAVRPEPPLPVNPLSFDARGSLVAFVGQTATQPPELWIRSGSDVRAVTRLNNDWNHPPLAMPEPVRYRSFDGVEVDAVLLKPRGYRDGARYPLIILVHGGPTGRWSDAFEPWGQLLASRGYAVLYPNIRGSVGYGSDFVEMNRADWGGGDFKDVMAGVDAMIERGIADPARLGIGGWSYGGYMSEWVITQTTRFKAAVAGAGLSDLASEFGTEDSSAYDEWFFGLPYEDPQPFVKSSPITYIKRARTPTLILQGAADVVDPIGQSQQLYRALKRYGVPTELVLYPREGHGFSEEKHLLDRLNRILDWFATYLKPTSVESGQAFPKLPVR
jgi:dipeptidyl aminopeptidase/acylaminoacyl peptidase